MSGAQNVVDIAEMILSSVVGDEHEQTADLALIMSPVVNDNAVIEKAIEIAPPVSSMGNNNAMMGIAVESDKFMNSGKHDLGGQLDLFTSIKNGLSIINLPTPDWSCTITRTKVAFAKVEIVATPRKRKSFTVTNTKTVSRRVVWLLLFENRLLTRSMYL